MDSINIKFKGIEQLVTNFGIAGGRVEKAVKFALEEAGGDLLKESVKIVPHDIGTLEGSGKVSDVKGSGNTMEIGVGYNTPYAARLHEHPEYKFQKGRRGKYLETPLKQKAHIYKKGIDAQVKKVLEGKI